MLWSTHDFKDKFHFTQEIDDEISYENYQLLSMQIDSAIQSDSMQLGDNTRQLIERKNAVLRGLMKEYLHSGDTSAALALLEGENTTQAKMMQYGILIDMERYDEAYAILNSLPDDGGEMELFKQIQRINLERLQQGLMYEMSAADSLFLESIAQNKWSVSAYARGIMGLLYGRDYTDDFEIDEASSSVRAVNSPEQMEEEMVVRPNPAEDEIVVGVPPLKSDGHLYIYSITGRVVYARRICSSEKETRIEIKCSSWQDGIYILGILDEEGSIHFAKRVIVSH